MDRVEKVVEKRDTSKLANQRVAVFDIHPTPVLQFANSQPPALLPLAGPDTPPGTPPHPIFSQRDPLWLWDRTRIPSPRPARIIERRAFIRNDFRPANPEWKEAGLLPRGKPIGSAPEYYSYGSAVAQHRECFYPETTTVGRGMRWQDGPWEL